MPTVVNFAPVRVAVAGLGRAGMFHVERLGLRDDCQVVAAYDDCPLAVERSGRPPVPFAESWKELLANDEVELVIIATPPALHAEMAISALASGKHVAVETPLGLNVAEVDAIRAAGRRSGKAVSVLHTRRWDDDFQTACEVLSAGSLGPPRAIKFINWHYNPSNAVDWRTDAATGGGVLWEFGVHYFDQLLQMAGSHPESVFARLHSSRDARVDDAFLAVVSFAGGLVAQIEVDRLATTPLQTGWIIAGDSGSYANFTQYTTNPDGEVVDLPLMPVAAEVDEFCTRLVRHLRRGSANPVTAEEARGSMALIEAVRKSARTGEVVRVDSVGAGLLTPPIG